MGQSWHNLRSEGRRRHASLTRWAKSYWRCRACGTVVNPLDDICSACGAGGPVTLPVSPSLLVTFFVSMALLLLLKFT
jgi:uncharacterized OB-fold protein